MLRGHSDTIVDMDMDQNGKLLATASGDGTVRTWFIKDMDKGKEIKLVDLLHFLLADFKTARTDNVDTLYIV